MRFLRYCPVKTHRGACDLQSYALAQANQAFHAIEPAVKRDVAAHLYDVVGPVCESGDWLGRGRQLAIEAGDLLAIRSAGAYGFVMSSNYNTRGRAAEVMVDGDKAHVVRAREDVKELFAGETVLPD